MGTPDVSRTSNSSGCANGAPATPCCSAPPVNCVRCADTTSGWNRTLNDATRPPRANTPTSPSRRTAAGSSGKVAFPCSSVFRSGAAPTSSAVTGRSSSSKPRSELPYASVAVTVTAPPAAPGRSVTSRGAAVTRSVRAGCVTNSICPPGSGGAPYASATARRWVPAVVPAAIRNVATPRAFVSARASSVDPPRIAPLPVSSSSVPASGALPRSSRTVTAASLPASAATLGDPTIRNAAPRAPPGAPRAPPPPVPAGPARRFGAAAAPANGPPRPPGRAAARARRHSSIAAKNALSAPTARRSAWSRAVGRKVTQFRRTRAVTSALPSIPSVSWRMRSLLPSGLPWPNACPDIDAARANTSSTSRTRPRWFTAAGTSSARSRLPLATPLGRALGRRTPVRNRP